MRPLGLSRRGMWPLAAEAGGKRARHFRRAPRRARRRGFRGRRWGGRVGLRGLRRIERSMGCHVGEEHRAHFRGRREGHLAAAAAFSAVRVLAVGGVWQSAVLGRSTVAVEPVEERTHCTAVAAAAAQTVGTGSLQIHLSQWSFSLQPQSVLLK